MRLALSAAVAVLTLIGAFALAPRGIEAQALPCTFDAHTPARDSLAQPFPDGRVAISVELACPAGFTTDVLESIRLYLDGRQILAHFFCCTSRTLTISNMHDATRVAAGPHVARIEVIADGVTYSTEWRFFVRIRPTTDVFVPGVVLATWMEGSGRAVHPQQVVDDIEGIPTARGARGVDVVSVWVTRDGEFSGYIVGAPAFVNASSTPL